MNRPAINRVLAATTLVLASLCASGVSAQVPDCSGTELAARVGLAVDAVRGEPGRPLYFHQLAITNPIGYTGEALADIGRDSAFNGSLAGGHDPDNGRIEGWVCLPKDIDTFFAWLLYAPEGGAPDIADLEYFTQYGGVVLRPASDDLLVLGEANVDCGAPGGIFDVVESRFEAVDRSDPDVQAICVSSAEEHLANRAVSNPALLGPTDGAGTDGNLLYVSDGNIPLWLSPLVDNVRTQNGTVINRQPNQRRIVNNELLLQQGDRDIGLCLDKAGTACFNYRVVQVRPGIDLDAPITCAAGQPVTLHAEFSGDYPAELWRRELRLLVDGEEVAAGEGELSTSVTCPVAGPVNVVAEGTLLRRAQFDLALRRVARLTADAVIDIN